MSTKRQEAEAWLTKWAEGAGGSIDDLLAALADFSMGNNDTFLYRGKVVGVFEGEDPEDEKIREDDSSWDLDERGWSSDRDHELWAHYKTLTGVSPWDKECRGC